MSADALTVLRKETIQGRKVVEQGDRVSHPAAPTCDREKPGRPLC